MTKKRDICSLRGKEKEKKKEWRLALRRRGRC